MTDDRDVIRREVPWTRQGWGLGLAIAACFPAAALWQNGGSGWPLAVTTGIVGIASVWAVVSRRVLVASPDGLRITRRPWSTRDHWIPRDQLVALQIRQHDDLGIMNESGKLDLEDPSSRWSVAVSTRDGREVWLAAGIEHADVAEQLVTEMREVLGGPAIPVHHTTTRSL